MSGGSKKQTVGYKYYLGAHIGLCHGPVDLISEIQVDQRVAWKGTATGGPITISAPALFGGEKREGGVSGTVDVEMGDSDQTQNVYLQSQLGTDIPSFRGVAAVVLNQCYMGNNPYMKPWKFLTSRIDITSDGAEQWYVDEAAIPRLGQDGIGNCSCTAIEDFYETGEFNLIIGNDGDLEIPGTQYILSESLGAPGFEVADLPAGAPPPAVSCGPQTLKYLREGNGSIVGGIDPFVSQDPRVVGDDVIRTIMAPFKLVLLKDVTDPAANQLRTAFRFVWYAQRVNGSYIQQTGYVRFSPVDTNSSGEFDSLRMTISWPGLCVSKEPPNGETSKASVLTIQGIDDALNNATTTGLNTFVLTETFDLSYAELFRDPGNPWIPLEIDWSVNDDLDTRRITTPYFSPTTFSGYDGEIIVKIGQPGPDGESLVIVSTLDAMTAVTAASDSQIATGVGAASWKVDPGGSFTQNIYFHANDITNHAVAIGGFGSAVGTFEEFTSALESNQFAGCGCDDMNPAHIIRECLTDSVWGMGYTDSDVDETSFTAAADTLSAEKLGMSILWEREQPIEDFIGEVLRHIDGVLYVSRETGKFVLVLIRQASSSATLDETNISSVTNVRRPTTSELTNAVSIVYWNPQADEDASLTLHNEALRQIQGVEISTTIQYPGFTNRNVARRIAERDLKALSTPVMSCEVTASRAAAGLNIGDVFTLDWPDLSINSTLMRVNEIDYGDGVDNSIKITAVQDVFTTPTESAEVEIESTWIDPTAVRPKDAIARVVDETPYYFLVTEIGENDANTILTDDADAGFLLVSGGRQGNEINGSVYVDSGAGYVESESLDFHPYALISASLSETDTVITVEGGKDLDLVPTGSLAQIGSELVRVDSLNTDVSGAIESVTVGRGVLDTVPQAHAITSPLSTYISFIGDFAVSDNEQYTAAEEIDAKIVTIEGASNLSLSAATAGTVTMNSRAIRPYPPGDLQIDSVSYPKPTDSPQIFWGADHTITWAHRDRLQQTDGFLYDYADASIGPESGTTYRIDVYSTLDDETESSIWWTDNVGSVNTYTMGSESPAIPSPPVDTAAVNIKVTAVRGGYDSWQAPVATINVSP